MSAPTLSHLCLNANNDTASQHACVSVSTPASSRLCLNTSVQTPVLIYVCCLCFQFLWNCCSWCFTIISITCVAIFSTLMIVMLKVFVTNDVDDGESDKIDDDGDDE